LPAFPKPAGGKRAAPVTAAARLPKVVIAHMAKITVACLLRARRQTRAARGLRYPASRENCEPVFPMLGRMGMGSVTP